VTHVLTFIGKAHPFDAKKLVVMYYFFLDGSVGKTHCSLSKNKKSAWYSRDCTSPNTQAKAIELSKFLQGKAAKRLASNTARRYQGRAGVLLLLKKRPNSAGMQTGFRNGLFHREDRLLLLDSLFSPTQDAP
jgi:hypothetical protein